MGLAIAKNVPVNSHVNFDHRKFYPMMVAAGFDATDSILMLIERGFDVNQQNNHGDTALHDAAYYGSMNACAALLNNANINAVNHNRRTPLMYAAHKGYKNMYELLIKKG